MLEVGNVYSLKYDGGTNPGHERTVLVVDSVGPCYGVMDYGLGGDFRHLTKTKVHTVKQLDAKVVDMKLLPGNIDIDDIVDGYENDGLDVLVHNQVVYAVEVPEVKSKFTIDSLDEESITFNVDGVLWEVFDDGSILSNGQKTLKDFVEALQKVV